jgi:hypothetical protein
MPYCNISELTNVELHQIGERSYAERRTTERLQIGNSGMMRVCPFPKSSRRTGANGTEVLKGTVKAALNQVLGKRKAHNSGQLTAQRPLLL